MSTETNYFTIIKISIKTNMTQLGSGKCESNSLKARIELVTGSYIIFIIKDAG